MAAGTEKNVNINLNVRDRTKAGLQKTKQNVKRAAEEVGRSTSMMVSDATGRKLTQFNERTERMRQVLMLSGNAAGTAAAQITYYGGSVSYLIGRLGPLEWAIMGVGGALALLGATLLKETEAEKAWKKALEDHKKALKETEDATKSLRGAEERRMLGLESDREYQEHLARKRWDEAKNTLAVQERAIEQAKQAVDKGEASITASEMREQIKRRNILRKRVDEQKTAYEEMRAAGKAFFDWEVRQAEIAAMEEEAAATAKGAKGPKETDWSMVRDWVAPEIELVFGMPMPAGTWDRLLTDMAIKQGEVKALTVEQQLDNQMAVQENLQRFEMAERERVEIERRSLEASRKLAQKRVEIGENVVGIMSGLGELMAQNEEQRQAAEVAGIIFHAGFKVTEEIAKAFGSYPDVAGMIAHGTAAANYAILAGANVKSAMSSGGGGIGGGSERGMGQEWRPQEKKELTIIVNLGGHEAGRAVAQTLEDYNNGRNPAGRRDKLS